MVLFILKMGESYCQNSRAQVKIFGRQCFLYLDVNGHILLENIPCTHLHFWVCVGEVPTHYIPQQLAVVLQGHLHTGTCT